MVLSWLKRKRAPTSGLVIVGTDFGSYQLLQVVQASSKYDVLGFVSSDPWQQRSGFGKIGVIYPEHLADFCDKNDVVAVIVPSDQYEHLLNDEEMQPVRELSELVRKCEVVAIPQTPSAAVADAFIDRLL